MNWKYYKIDTEKLNHFFWFSVKFNIHSNIVRFKRRSDLAHIYDIDTERWIKCIKGTDFFNYRMIIKPITDEKELFMELI